MPTYQYECSACGHGFETMQSMAEKKLKKCPECGRLQLHRLIGTGSGIIFKGTGFYETDYKRKDAPSSSGRTESAGAGKHAGKSEAASAKSAPTSSKESALGEDRRESRRFDGKASGPAPSKCCGGGACGH